MKGFPNRLRLEATGHRDKRRVFILLNRFCYVSSLGVIEVPAGTLTDGASVPRAFWSIFEPFGEYFEAAVIHDFLYSPANGRFTRAQSDFIFKEAMFNVGVPWYRREPIYRAVQLFGGSSFRANLNNLVTPKP